MSEAFERMCPKYMAMGMTPEEYWRGSPELARYYRQADELRLERQNQLLWLQGLYVYDALCAASPVFRSLAKKGTKPLPYMDSPVPLTKRDKEHCDEQGDKRVMDKGKAYFATLLANQNRKQGGNSDGGHH